MSSEFDAIAADWRPAPVTVTGVLEEGATAKLAALLGVATPDELPPLWHEIHLRDAVNLADLGADGHPRSGPLLPPLADRRRMFGGGTVEILAPLRVGERATRMSRVGDVRVREGRSGTLLLVTEEHVWSVGGEDRLRERRDIVYRRAADVGVPAPAPPAVEESGGMAADERYLFAYSALTYNLHRIHYDDRYAREVEGHPGLVVHGPLLALWCAEYARGRDGTVFSYRLTSTAYVGQKVAITGHEEDGALVVEARAQGRTCVRMTVR